MFELDFKVESGIAFTSGTRIDVPTHNLPTRAWVAVPVDR
jgi:hypothetical protein